MPLPKRRHSHARTAKRRTHWKQAAPNLAPCPHCSESKLSHQICPHCGYYAGRQVLAEDKLKS